MSRLRGAGNQGDEGILHGRVRVVGGDGQRERLFRVIRVNVQESFELIVRFAQNDIEWLQATVIEETVSPFRVDRHHPERMVEEYGMSGRILEPNPPGLLEKFLDFPRFGGDAVVLGLGNTERYQSVTPSHDRDKAHIVAENLVARQPSC